MTFPPDSKTSYVPITYKFSYPLYGQNSTTSVLEELKFEIGIF